jgi:putative intracellular protease/amidase
MIRTSQLLGLCFMLGVNVAAIEAQPTPPATNPFPKKLGILIFPGVQVIDFTGPYEVFTSARSNRRPLFDVVTVGLSSDMIQTNSGTTGLKITPDYSIEKCPKLDILMIPGGDIKSVENSTQAMDFVAKNVREADCVMSVCNGAFILAKGGHLKGQSATTFYYFLDALKKAEPTCTVVHDQRFVDNGKIVTTAGLTSGIDGALHMVERYSNRFDAEQVALGLEYNWRPDLNYSRANLADRHLIKVVGPGFSFPSGNVASWTVVENNGTAESWTKGWTFKSGLKRDELIRVFESKLAPAWTKVTTKDNESLWSFKDEKGNAWEASLKLNSVAERAWSTSIQLSRVGKG